MTAAAGWLAVRNTVLEFPTESKVVVPILLVSQAFSRACVACSMLPRVFMFVMVIVADLESLV